MKFKKKPTINEIFEINNEDKIELIFIDKDINLLKEIILDAQFKKDIIIFRSNLYEKNNDTLFQLVNLKDNIYIYCRHDLMNQLKSNIKIINIIFKILSGIIQIKKNQKKVNEKNEKYFSCRW